MNAIGADFMNTMKWTNLLTLKLKRDNARITPFVNFLLHCLYTIPREGPTFSRGVGRGIFAFLNPSLGSGINTGKKGFWIPQSLACLDRINRCENYGTIGRGGGGCGMNRYGGRFIEVRIKSRGRSKRIKDERWRMKNIGWRI